MNKFHVIELHNKPYDFLIIASPYENPLNTFGEVVDALNVNKAQLLFDLTLINGLKENRYVACNYEKGQRLLPSCVLVNDVAEPIKSLSNNFFKQHEDIVQKSIIPNAMKFLLTKTDLVS